MLESFIVEPTKSAKSAIIWLHGLGASGYDFESVLPLLGIDISTTRFIFPHAPRIPITVNGGIEMSAWYDIEHVDISRTIDVAGIRTSADQVDQIVQNQIVDGIDSKKIILAGFSQGGAVALYTGVRSSEPLAGVLALSTYWVGDQDSMLVPGNIPTELPIEIHHGKLDPVVPYALGEQAVKSLRDIGYFVTFRSFSMMHCIAPEQLSIIGSWIALLFLDKE